MTRLFTGRLLAAVAALVVLVGCTPDQIATWKAHHRGPPAFSSAYVGRTCTGLEPLLAYYSPGWDVAKMARIAYRESGCHLHVRTWCCFGVLQIHQQHFARASRELGITVNHTTIWDPVVNVRVAAWLWRQSRYRPWGFSG